MLHYPGRLFIGSLRNPVFMAFPLFLKGLLPGIYEAQFSEGL